MSFDDEKEGGPQMPSWLVEDNDKKHVQETVAPLFGTGAVNLLDAAASAPSSVPFATAAPPSKKDKAATAASSSSSYGSTGVTAQQKQQQRTTEQAAQEIQSLAKAYNKLQQQKQQAEENRRLFSQQQNKNGGGADDWNGGGSDDGLDSSSVDNSSKASSSKKKKIKSKSNNKPSDAFGPIDSRSMKDGDMNEQDEQDDDDNMNISNDEEKQALLLKEQLKPHIPKQNACLWFFHLLAGFTVIVLLCLVATQIIPVVAVQRAAAVAAQHGNATVVPWWQTIGIFSLALKVYISIFSLCFCLVELHLPMPFLQSANLLQNFISRGFIYSFVGLVATSEAYQEHVTRSRISSSLTGSNNKPPAAAVASVADSLAKEVPWEAIFMQVSAWVMLGIGFFYTFLGLLCLQPLFERLRAQERLDWQKYRTDYRAWKRVYGKK